MIDPMTGMMIAKGVSALGNFVGNWLNGPQKPIEFEKTPYAVRLKKIMEQGSIPDSLKQTALSETSRQAGAVTSKAKSDYAGRLSAMGAEGSIAGAEKLADIDTKQINAITETGRQIDTQNTMAKKQAADQYASSKTEYEQNMQDYEQQKKAQKGQAIGGLISSVADIAGDYIGGKYQQKLEAEKTQWEHGKDIADVKLKRGELQQKKVESVLDYLSKTSKNNSDKLRNSNIVSIIEGYLTDDIKPEALNAFMTKEFGDDLDERDRILDSILALKKTTFAEYPTIKGRLPKQTIGMPK